MYMLVYVAMVALVICILLHMTFQVSVGAYISESLSQPLVYVAPSSIPLVIIIPVIAGSVVVVVILSLFIICCVVCYHRKKSKKNEQRWTNLLSQMELMELEMADECKRGKRERERESKGERENKRNSVPH